MASQLGYSIDTTVLMNNLKLKLSRQHSPIQQDTEYPTHEITLRAEFKRQRDSNILDLLAKFDTQYINDYPVKCDLEESLR